jgi:RNA polymerase sigma factor (sigma-70 family)
MIPDRELLHHYAEHGDEPAFAEVVRRHVDWVYSSALRLTAGDAPLAQDVTQMVFIDLAGKAAKLSRHDSLGGWLHTAARFAAAKAVHRERRRRERELKACAMPTEPSASEIPWENVRPLLDAAIGNLDEADRNVVVLRFFEGKSHREIGDRTGLSEDSARKRTERAVEKLRAQFARRGINLSAGLLAEAISANSVQAAPVGLASKVTGFALQGSASAGVTGARLISILSMTTKAKIILVAAILFCAAILYIHFDFFPTNQLREKPAMVSESSKGLSMVEAPTGASRPPKAEASGGLAPSLTGSKPISSNLTGALPASDAARSLAEDGVVTLTERVNALIAGRQVILGTSPDIWAPIPGRDNGIALRAGVRIISFEEFYGDVADLHGSGVYYLTAENRFYIDWRTGSGSGSNSGGCYGPFQGDPYDVLDLPRPEASNGPDSSP